MRRLWLVAAVAALTGCGGQAPPLASPDAALNQPRPCQDVNTPPPGWRGPVSPHGLGCAGENLPAVAPSGVHDYGRGQPPRAVRGQ